MVEVKEENLEMKKIIVGLAATLATTAAQGGQSSLCPLRSEVSAEYRGCVSTSKEIRTFLVNIPNTHWQGEMVELAASAVNHYFFGQAIIDGDVVEIYGTPEDGPIEAVVVSDYIGM